MGSVAHTPRHLPHPAVAGQLEPGLGGCESLADLRKTAGLPKSHKVSGRSIVLAERVEVVGGMPHGSVWAEQAAVLDGMPDKGRSSQRRSRQTSQQKSLKMQRVAEQDSGSMFEQAFSEAQHGLQDDDDGMFEDAFEEAQQG
ncbi:unnamed protein product, partial [Effrenium voratum]